MVMKKLLLLLYFLSQLAFGQNKGIWKPYIDIPSGPTFSSPYVVVPGDACCGGGIFTPPSGSETSGGNVTPNGDFNGVPGGFSARQWVGDRTHIWRIMPTAGTILGTAAGSGHGYSQTGYGTWQFLYGQTPANPGVSKGQFGIFFSPATVARGGGHWSVQNWVVKSSGAGSYQFNGDQGTDSYYDSLWITYCRAFTSGQENIYGGKTSAGGAVINYSYVKHFFGYNSFRDGGQIQGCKSVDWSNITFIGAGQGGEAAQTNNIQVHNSNGRIHHSIFQGGVTAGQIFAHGFRFDHNLVTWTTSRFLLGRTDSQSYAGSAQLNGDSVIIENICFKKTGTAETSAIDVQLRDAPIMIRNCTFDNISATYVDNRVPGYSNTITGTIGTKGNVTGTCPDATFVSGYNDPDDYAHQGKQTTTSPWYLLCYGFLGRNGDAIKH